MLSSLKEEDKSFDFIINAINQYNNGKPLTDTLKLIYTGTSAQLAYIGKRATIIKPKESEILTVPYALIPARLLQKKYGIYPLSHLEIGLKNKAKFRNKLYSLPLGPAGHARYHDHFAEIKNAHKVKQVRSQVLEVILQIGTHNYIRSLKKLLLLLTSMMIIDPPDEKKTQHYLTLIKKENDHLKQQFLHDKNRMLAIQKYFDKYFPRFESILNGKIPFQADNKFREEIVNQFPIIFCSTASDMVEDQGEFAYNGELDIKTIKLLFTPKRHMNDLKAKLKEIGLNEIEVIGFDSNGQLHTSKHKKTNIETAFLYTNAYAEMLEIINKHPDLLKMKPTVTEKLVRSLQNFSETNDHESFMMAAWLLKHSGMTTLEEVDGLIAKYANLMLAELIQTKAEQDKHYYSVVNELVPEYYITHINHFSYLKALHLSRKAIEETAHIFDYSKECNHSDLDELVKPKGKMKRPVFLFEYLTRLQNLYLILTRDIGSSIEHEANIRLRLAFIRNKYLELLQEYKQFAPIPAALNQSELYLWVSGLLNENKKILVTGLLIQVGQPTLKKQIANNHS